MRNIEDEALAATQLTMKPARRVLRAAEAAAKVDLATRRLKYHSKWNKVYNEILAELQEDEDAGH
jgi:formate dehydrogenase maturation protein FdhE